MAVCKTCGCAIPIGRKSCDMCAAVGAVAPAQQAWTPPKEVAAPQELSSSAASWAAASGAARPAVPTDLKKAEKPEKPEKPPKEPVAGKGKGES